MNRCKTLALLLLLYLIWHLPQRSTAGDSDGEGVTPTPEPVHQASPTPGPIPGTNNSDSGSAKTVDVINVKPPVSSRETCEMVASTCHDDVANVTACVFSQVEDGPMGLIVLNKGDGPIKFNVTTLPLEPTYDNIEVAGHEVRKINVSASVSSTPSVVLTAVNWTCTIQLGFPIPLAYPSYTAYVTPINGGYLLFATALLIGGSWACCKLREKRRHLDGVPYQELEMGQQQSISSTNVETTNGWDQDWDDDWDEEKAVKPSVENHVGKRRANGSSSRSTETNGRGDDWND